MVARIIARAETLDRLSFTGRRVPEYDQDNVREVGEPPYRIIYRVTANVVEILTVMHERQLLPDEIPSD